jgi:hypothetical protein
MTDEQLRKLIVQHVPPDEEFWKSECEDDFLRKAKDLIEHGYSTEEAVEFLADLYYLVAGEFGG